MIHEPPIDELAKKVGSKYALCIVAAKRARQLLDYSSNQVGKDQKTDKPLSLAAVEIQEGKVTATKF
ncbi:MAG: DNA-directed RNA polymerase subunit omega [Clostridia bacterium]|nr:DNA-directed RNA polymerase subunit omega [Clostridia bacterium]